MIGPVVAVLLGLGVVVTLEALRRRKHRTATSKAAASETLFVPQNADEWSKLLYGKDVTKPLPKAKTARRRRKKRKARR